MADLRLGIDASRAKRGGDQFNNQLDKIQRNTKQTQRQLKRTGASVDKFGQSISRVGKLFVAAAVAFAGREIIQLSDSFTRLTNSIRIATDTQEELQAVTGAVFDIAFRTRAPVESLGILYGRAALAADALGATQQELLQFTEGVGKALAIQGTSAGEARGALLQLSQAIGGSIVRAEEFNSLIEGARPILIAVAANLDDTGVSLTELRQRVVEGKLTSAEFFRAFLKGTKDLDELFQKTAPTIGQGFEAIRTGATLAVGQFNLLTGASTSFAETLQEVGKQIGTNLLPFLAGFAAQFQILAQTIRTGIIELLRMTGLLPGLSGEFTQTADDVGLIIRRRSCRRWRSSRRPRSGSRSSSIR
jgi:tape measure domain-containing protein